MITNRARHVIDEWVGLEFELHSSSEDILAQFRISLLGQAAPVPVVIASLFASPLFASSAARCLPACHCTPPRQLAVCLLGNTPFHDGRMDDGAHDGADGRMMVQMMVQMDDGSLPSPSLAVCRLREVGCRHAN